MPRKVILDIDPGIDDAVALAMAFADPRVEVVAVTAVAGNVSADEATRNVYSLITQIDPPKWPRVGVASEPEHGAPIDSKHLFGADGLGNLNLPFAEPQKQHASERVIADEIRAAPEEVTLFALGPLTNVARVFRRDPALAAMVGQVFIMGGSVSGPGNVTPAAEFNIYFDPVSARAVFQARATKVLVPLDVSSQVLFGYDLLERLPPESTRIGSLLRRMLPYAFRSHHRELGLEGIHLHDAVAYLAAMEPDLFELEPAAAEVETIGEWTKGATVFDRRSVREWRCNMHVAMRVNVPAAKDRLYRILAAGQ